MKKSFDELIAESPKTQLAAMRFTETPPESEFADRRRSSGSACRRHQRDSKESALAELEGVSRTTPVIIRKGWGFHDRGRGANTVS